jgi:hypothetical protein
MGSVIAVALARIALAALHSDTDNHTVAWCGPYSSTVKSVNPIYAFTINRCCPKQVVYTKLLVRKLFYNRGAEWLILHLRFPGFKFRTSVWLFCVSILRILLIIMSAQSLYFIQDIDTAGGYSYTSGFRSYESPRITEMRKKGNV